MKLIELLYPRTCPFCGKVNRSGICEECKEKLPYIREPRCKKCGKPVRGDTEEYCHDCRKRPHNYEQGRSLWLHQTPVMESIYQFKYDHKKVYAEAYAKEMVRCFEALIREWNIDLIVPVPLHKKRRRKRGYNQAELIAGKLGEMLAIPVDSELLVRVKNTKPQKQLNDRERHRNLKHAFQVTKRSVCAENILLIDDIYTTGNTIDYAAEMLKQESAAHIYFLTISIGQGF